MMKGDLVRVVERYDDTLPEEYVGRLGFVLQRLPYQGIGDRPEEGDPTWLVLHSPYFGAKACKQLYWSEEISVIASGQAVSRTSSC